MDQIISLKREVFRWKMRKQALEKEFIEKRRTTLQQHNKQENKQYNLKDLSLAITEDKQIDQILDYLLSQDNYLEISAQAYDFNIHTSLTTILLQSTDLPLLELIIMFLNDMLIAVTELFGEKLQDVIYKLCWLVDYKNQVYLSNACLVLLGNLILDQEKIVIDIVIEKNLFKKLPGKFEEECFFMCNFSKQVKEKFLSSEALVTMMNLILDNKSVKLIKSFSLLTKCIQDQQEMLNFTRYNQFPLFLTTLLETLQHGGNQNDMLRYFTAQSLRRLMDQCDKNWVKVMIQTGLLEGIKQMLLETPSLQREALKLLNRTVQFEEYYEMFVDFFNQQQITDLMNSSDRMRGLDVFTQILHRGDTALSRNLIQNNIIQYYYEGLKDLDPKIILLTLQMLILVVDIDDSDEWYQRIDRDFDKFGIIPILESLTKNQDTEIQMNSSYILDTIN